MVFRQSETELRLVFVTIAEGDNYPPQPYGELFPQKSRVWCVNIEKLYRKEYKYACLPACAILRSSSRIWLLQYPPL
jgi:hypothetical protein